MATGKKMGRPPGISPYPNKEQIKDELVQWISNGKTLREFCRQDGMPNFSVMYDWEAEDKDFAQRIAHARLKGHDVIAEECAALSDTEPLAVFDEAGNKRYDPGSIAWRKMQIETRLKLLAKWNPRKYGDKTILAGDDQAPVVIEASFDIFGELLKNLALKRQAGE
ncbi:hypothetical protein UFOVP125_48 [uncultured Caudovirales phage]|uniref:Terminase small subunit n=1 Tax=uncultured Caudovirales phage TaxID=2100421 RepID=A0A6J5LB20_9CAUD|nr:hypothetical protein UFOVP125_48 [uncultured Caudovirales phage]